MGEHALPIGGHLRGVASHVSAHLDVLPHCHVGEYPPALGAVRDAAPEDLLRRQPLDLDAIEHDAPRRCPDEPGDGLERGRLARAVGADEADQLGRAHVSDTPSSAVMRP